MRTLILIGLLAALAGCSTYTDRTSPCIGRKGSSEVSRGTAMPVLSFTPDVSRDATDTDCIFRPIGAGA